MRTKTVKQEMRTILLALLCIMFVGLATSANLTVELVDAEGDRLNSELILEQNQEIIAESESFLEADVNAGEEYNLTQNINDGPNVTVRDFSIDEDFDFKPLIYNEKPGPDSEFLIEADLLYFVNQSISFSETSIAVDRSEPDRIAKCENINNGECIEWTVNQTSDYRNSVDDSDIDGDGYTYIVEEFSGYTTGNNAPLPQIENLQIFDVTEETDQRENGKLKDEGLNKTFLIDQKENREYRFSFTVSNQGSESWNLDSEDNLQHEGLNESWNVFDIYYEIETSVEEGGTFSNGDVEWNTGNGGILAENEEMETSYIVNVTQDSTNIFQQVFEAESTSSTGDSDFHELEVLKYGFLNAEIERPENNTVVQNNREFLMNGTVWCSEGDCGEIDFEPRRNGSSGQQSFTGDVFEVVDRNTTENCVDLLEDNICEVEWGINATGEPNTFHDLDFEASSIYEEVDADETEKNTVEIRDILMISLDWDRVNFGVLDPGDQERPAENNSQGYNVSVDDESNTVDNLWVKASSLTHESNENYRIGPGNMTYAEENSYSSSTNFTESYSLFDTDLAPGTTKNLYYWLNVPYGILKGGYSGTITFKANSTTQ